MNVAIDPLTMRDFTGGAEPLSGDDIAFAMGHPDSRIFTNGEWIATLADAASASDAGLRHRIMAVIAKHASEPDNDYARLGGDALLRDLRAAMAVSL